MPVRADVGGPPLLVDLVETDVATLADFCGRSHGDLLPGIRYAGFAYEFLRAAGRQARGEVGARSRVLGLLACGATCVGIAAGGSSAASLDRDGASPPPPGGARCLWGSVRVPPASRVRRSEHLFVLVIVTGLPPVVGPDDSATDATVGAANVVVLRLTVIDPLWLSTVTMSGRPSLFMSPAPMVVDAPLMIDFV